MPGRVHTRAVTRRNDAPSARQMLSHGFSVALGTPQTWPHVAHHQTIAHDSTTSGCTLRPPHRWHGGGSEASMPDMAQLLPTTGSAKTALLRLGKCIADAVAGAIDGNKSTKCATQLGGGRRRGSGKAAKKR